MCVLSMKTGGVWCKPHARVLCWAAYALLQYAAHAHGIEFATVCHFLLYV